MRIGFIGAGKVGFTLGKLFAESGFQVTGYYSRHLEPAEEAAKFTGSNCYKDLDALICQSDAIFITVPDGSICSVYEQMKQYNIKGKQICHCSGAMSSEEAFSDIREQGAFGYSIHPLFPVSSRYDSYKELSGAFFCLEGDAAHMEEWMKLFTSIGIKCRQIKATDKVKYHAGCVMASNLVCGLIQEGMDLLMGCGFEEEEALLALRPLMTSNILAVAKNGPRDALTGPIERNDWETVEKHMKAMPTEEEKNLYAEVSKKVVQLAKERHKQRDYKKLEQVLEMKS